MHGADGERRHDGHVDEQRAAGPFLDQHAQRVGDDARVDRLPHGRAVVRDGRVLDERGAQQQRGDVHRHARGERAVEADGHVQEAGGARADRRGDEVQRHEHADALGAVLDARDVRHVGRDAHHAADARPGDGGHQALGDGGHGGRPVPVVHVEHVERVRHQLAGDRYEHQRPAAAAVRVAPRPREQYEHQRHRVLDGQLPRLDLGHQLLRVALVQALVAQVVRLLGGRQVAALTQYQVRAHLRYIHTRFSVVNGGRRVREKKQKKRKKKKYI